MLKNRSKLSILFIGLIPPDRGGRILCGTAIHGWDLACHFHRQGHRVRFIARVDGHSSPYELEGVTIVPMPVGTMSKIVNAGSGIIHYMRHNRDGLAGINIKEKIAVLARIPFLSKELDEAKPDVVHIHGIENSWPLSIKILRPDLPIVISDHGFWPTDSEFQRVRFVDAVLKKVDFLIPVSDVARNQEIRLGLESSLSSRVIRNPISSSRIPFIEKNDARRALGWDCNKKMILFSGVCQSLAVKGLKRLLGAASATEDLKNRVRLVIIADEEGVEYARNKAISTGLDISVFGPQAWDKIVLFYNSADVFVLPSNFESFGLVFLESLLAGIPVIGYSHAIEELQDVLGIAVGEKFDPHMESEHDLAEKIIRVLEKPYDREVLRQRVLEKFEWGSKMHEYESIYFPLIEKRS